MAQKLTVGILGIKRVEAAFKMMKAQVRERMQRQVKQSVDNVTAGAKQRVPVSGPQSRKAKGRLGPGELRDTIRGELVEDGLTGFVKAGYGKLTRRTKAAGGRRRVGASAKHQNVPTLTQFMRAQEIDAYRMDRALTREAGVYAMVTEYGSPGRGQPAQPFLRPAKEAELPALRKGVGDALRESVDASKQPAPGITA